jgi:hypothetical protein
VSSKTHTSIGTLQSYDISFHLASIIYYCAVSLHPCTASFFLLYSHLNSKPSLLLSTSRFHLLSFLFMLQSKLFVLCNCEELTIVDNRWAIIKTSKRWSLQKPVRGDCCKQWQEEAKSALTCFCP